MGWVQFTDGFRLDPVAKRSPEALVVLLHNVGASAATLAPIAPRSAPAVPATAFMAPEGLEALDAPFCDSLDVAAESTVLDCTTRRLELLFEQQLRLYRLDTSRVVLVGFGNGGTLALHRERMELRPTIRLEPVIVTTSSGRKAICRKRRRMPRR